MFRNRKYYHIDFTELNRRVRRQFEGNINYRRLLLLIFLLAIVILYIGPYTFAWLFGATPESKGTYEVSDVISHGRKCVRALCTLSPRSKRFVTEEKTEILSSLPRSNRSTFTLHGRSADTILHEGVRIQCTNSAFQQCRRRYDVTCVRN